MLAFLAQIIEALINLSNLIFLYILGCAHTVYVYSQVMVYAEVCICPGYGCSVVNENRCVFFADILLICRDSSDSDRELEARYSRWLHPNRSHMDRGANRCIWQVTRYPAIKTSLCFSLTGDSSAQPSCSRWTDSQSPCVSMFAPPVFSSSGSSSCPAYKVPFRMHVDQA